jgi:hypothetical protein
LEHRVTYPKQCTEVSFFNKLNANDESLFNTEFDDLVFDADHVVVSVFKSIRSEYDAELK